MLLLMVAPGLGLPRGGGFPHVPVGKKEYVHILAKLTTGMNWVCGLVLAPPQLNVARDTMMLP